MKVGPRDFVDIRLSHLLRDCSVGAIVRSDETLMVVQDTRYWDGPKTNPYDREIRYVELVKRSLNLDRMKLCRPPVKQRQGGHVQGWVAAQRFPHWTRCNHCGLLHHKPWMQQGASHDEAHIDSNVRLTGIQPETFKCEGTCRNSENRKSQRVGTLEQVLLVLVHECGHLADAPWHVIAHSKSKQPKQLECRPHYERPYLQLNIRQGRWNVDCTDCGARQRVPDRFPCCADTWYQPWERRWPDHSTQSSELGWLISVNDVRVHFPECRTALIIPPESRVTRGSPEDLLYSNSADRRRINRARNPRARSSRIRTVAKNYLCSPEDVEGALAKIARGYPYHEMELPHGRLALLEYSALVSPIPNVRPDEDLVTEHQPWPNPDGEKEAGSMGIARAVNCLVAVHRIKEIMVFDGFRRGWGSSGEPVPITRPDIVGESDWLPALELWGEGLFFTLDEDLVSRWERQEFIQRRTSELLGRARAARLPRDVEEAFSPRFLLCHTLAHLVIRRLETEAGYPAASIKERIYCAAGDVDGKSMAGILIYVSVADEHGSLGGLADMAHPDRFSRLLTGAVEDASWCSFDPVCAEREGHGPDLLNRAACHACALLPEPSCICGNRLLDRTFVMASAEDVESLFDIGMSRETSYRIVT